MPICLTCLQARGEILNTPGLVQWTVLREEWEKEIISTTNTTPTLLTKVMNLRAGASKLLAKIMVYLHIMNTIWAHPILDFLNILANV